MADPLEATPSLAPPPKRAVRSRSQNVNFKTVEAYRSSGLGVCADTRKKTTIAHNTHTFAVCTAMQGWRKTMEDASFNFSANLTGLGPCDVYGVFDGHNGDHSAQFCAERFPNVLIEEFAKSVVSCEERGVLEALKASFCRVDEEYEKSSTPPPGSGSTALIMIVTQTQIIVANAGDCRAVRYSGASGYVALSRDHKPNLESEKERITKAGKTVENGRIVGSQGSTLSVSRGIGDYSFKDMPSLPRFEQAVSCEPEVTVVSRSCDDRFVVVGCDGIWEENTDTVEEKKKEAFVGKVLRSVPEKDFEKAKLECEYILGEIMAPVIPATFGVDNMTLIGAFFIS